MMKRAKTMENHREKRLKEVKSLLKDYENRKSLVIKQENYSVKKYLKVHNLSYTIKKNELFNSINFEISKGDRLWIKGANGTGKTILLSILSREIDTYSGRIHRNPDIDISYAK